jgi:hypothetical protein
MFEALVPYHKVYARRWKSETQLAIIEGKAYAQTKAIRDLSYIR